jgi:hypothetical protein
MTQYALYVDDSGHPSDQERVVAAGFIASVEQWQRFDTEWVAVVARHELGIFHMTDFEAAKRKDRGRVLQHLVEVIQKNTSSSFSCLVSMAAYKKINDIYALEEAIGTPYSIAMRGLVRNVNLWKKNFLDPSDTVSVFVEQGTLHFGDMQEAFRRDGLPIPRSVPKNNVRVQPADMLAWEVFRYDQIGPIRRSMKELVKYHQHLATNHGMFLEDNILISCQQMGNVHKRSELPPNAQHVYHSSPKRMRRRTIK